MVLHNHNGTTNNMLMMYNISSKTYTLNTAAGCTHLSTRNCTKPSSVHVNILQATIGWINNAAWRQVRFAQIHNVDILTEYRTCYCVSVVLVLRYDIPKNFYFLKHLKTAKQSYLRRRVT